MLTRQESGETVNCCINLLKESLSSRNSHIHVVILETKIKKYIKISNVQKTFIHFTITIKRSHQHLILFRLHHSIKSKMYSICSSIGLALSHGSLNNKMAYE